jgi:hypothetical protein
MFAQQASNARMGFAHHWQASRGTLSAWERPKGLPMMRKCEEVHHWQAVAVCAQACQ